MKKETSDEENPLLSKRISNRIELMKIFFVEFITLLKIAIPAVLTNLGSFLLLSESIIMTGHLTKYDFDASTLANSIINVAGISVGTGLCTACDTFFSQMYSSKHKKSIGMVLQKAIMIISLFPIILAAIHINIFPIFILLRQDHIVARKAAKYMCIFIPGLFFAFNYLILTRYMQSQNKVFPPMIIGIFVNVFNILSQYVTIYQLKWGLYASAVCQAISFFLFWLIELIYILKTKLYIDTWNGWTKDAFLDWGLFTKLAIPGAAMVVLECFSFEIGTILSGTMGTVQLAVQSVIFQLQTFTFMVHFGVALAVNIRVGQALGAGQPELALRSYRCGLLIIAIICGFTSSVLLSSMYHLPKLFTNDKETQILSSQIFPIMIGVQCFDAIGTVTMGALRGCGKQKTCVVIIFCSYYLLGQPIGISLAFVAHMKVKGLWVGLLISLAICVPIAFIYANFIQDWKKQAEICQQRIAKAALKFEQEYQVQDNKDPSRPSEVIMTSYRGLFTLSFTINPLTKTIETRLVEVNKSVYTQNFIKRFIIFFVTILILLAGILVRIFLPESSFMHIVTNYTQYPL